MLFRQRNLLGKPSKLTIAMAAAGLGVAAAASSAAALTWPGSGAAPGSAAASAYLRGAGSTPAAQPPRSAEQWQAMKTEAARQGRLLAAARARRAARAATAARRAAAHRASVLAARRQARKPRTAPGTPAAPAAPAQPPGSPRQAALSMLGGYGWPASQFSCLDALWAHESGWSVSAANPDGAYGIPQALPGSKMASAGRDWQASAATQIRWGLSYIKGLYGSPCGAWSHEEATGWY